MMAFGERDAGPALLTVPDLESSTLDQSRRTFRVSGVTYQLVLLPVWVGLLERDGRWRVGLINGQTGKAVVGSLLPKDWDLDAQDE
jgi:hypothetical protein